MGCDSENKAMSTQKKGSSAYFRLKNPSFICHGFDKDFFKFRAAMERY